MNFSVIKDLFDESHLDVWRIDIELEHDVIFRLGHGFDESQRVIGMSDIGTSSDVIPARFALDISWNDVPLRLWIRLCGLPANDPIEFDATFSVFLYKPTLG